MVLAAFVAASLYLLRRAFRAVRALIELGRGIQASQREVVDLLREAIETQRALRTATEDIRKTVRLAAFYQRPVVRDHLAVMERSAVAGSAVSLRLARVADRIFPAMAYAPPGDPETVLCTVAIGEDYRARVQACLDSHKAYAARHGLAYCVLEKPIVMWDRLASHDRAPSWLKIPLIYKLLAQGYRRVFYLDADAMITDMDFVVDALFSRLEQAGRAVLITEDEGGVNCGVMFVRNCDAALSLVDLVWHSDDDVHNPTWEQQALRGLMDTSNAVAATVLIEPNPKIFNSFPVERRGRALTRPDQIWSPGDFICHFCAMRTPDLERCIAHYVEAIAGGALRSPVPGVPLAGAVSAG
ncbi:MAG: hypothetical protein P4M07_06130 [Xanthobacteraceae bacterium]|nr:hypothetical protein [Xanthobacteraceae bacterium]